MRRLANGNCLWLVTLSKTVDGTRGSNATAAIQNLELHSRPIKSIRQARLGPSATGFCQSLSAQCNKQRRVRGLLPLHRQGQRGMGGKNPTFAPPAIVYVPPVRPPVGATAPARASQRCLARHKPPHTSAGSRPAICQTAPHRNRSTTFAQG